MVKGLFGLQERLLLLLSRKPGGADYERGREWNVENALSLLSKVFPGFTDRIVDKEVLEYGCGGGYQAVAMALNGARYVLGLDISQAGLQNGRELARQYGVEHQVEFSDRLDNLFKDKFDMVVSQNSMEHFEDPEGVLKDMKTVLRHDGSILITFGPPWFAPYGSHTYFFTKIPWVNIIFNEKAVMNVRSYFRNDGALKYEEIKGGLNRMSVGSFEQLIFESDMKVQYCKYNCVKGLDFFCKVPFFRELFVNHINCILSK